MAEERSSDGAGPSPHSSTRTVLLSGACSGLLARLFTHPLDTVKARLQVQAAVRLADVAAGAVPSWAALPYAGTSDALTKVLRSEGVAGFYRGFGAVVSAVPAASAVYFGGYELSKRALHGTTFGDALGASGTYVLAGIVAQAAAGLVYTPMDVVKERMQVQALLRASAGGGGYRGSADAAASILRAEGVRGLFKGYWAANAAWWPWNVLYFVTYEHARDAAAEAAGVRKEALPPLVSALCGGAAATLATVATNPIDVVKTRLQTKVYASSAEQGALGVARAMWAAEGAAAFGAGMGARVLSIAPGSFISFFTYEAIKRAVAAAEESRAEDAAAAAGAAAFSERTMAQQ